MSKDDEPAVCDICGEPMPEGEEMFRYHGFSGPCPAPSKKSKQKPWGYLHEGEQRMVRDFLNPRKSKETGDE